MTAGKVLTPDLMYRAAAVVALVDAGLAALLWWRIGTDGVRRARWTLPAIAGVFWFGVWMAVHALYWERVYSHVFPAWSRFVIPPIYGLGFAGVAALWRWIALRAPRLAVPVFLALWGVTGALTHTYAVYARGLLERSPMLQHLTPASAIVFATFEFGFYGCVMLTLATFAQRTLDRRGARPGANHTPVSASPG